MAAREQRRQLRDGSPVPDHPTRPDFEPPIQFWNPSVSPSGLLFYTGERFPAWRGNALMGGLSSMALIRLTLDGSRVTGEERIDMGKRIRDVTQGFRWCRAPAGRWRRW